MNRRRNPIGGYLGWLSCLFCAALLTASLAAAPPEELSAQRAPVAAERGDGSFRAQYPPLRDEAVMLLVGTVLIGLAAAVRRLA